MVMRVEVHAKVLSNEASRAGNDSDLGGEPWREAKRAHRQQRHRERPPGTRRRIQARERRQRAKSGIRGAAVTRGDA